MHSETYSVQLVTPTGNNTMDEVDHTIINAATAILPYFSPNQTHTWFRRAERHFHLKRITVRTPKADYTIEVLTESIFQHISPWLDMQPAEIKYEDLKAMLLKKFRPTSSIHAQRILDLPQQPMSDRTPSQIWHEIFTLLQLPDINEDTGSHKQLDLHK